MQIIISKHFRDDITQIYKYIAKNSLKYANVTVNKIYSRVAMLEVLPYLGRIIQEFSDKQYRELLYKRYRIFYEVSEETNTIYIHFVVHEKRNFNSFYKSYIRKNKFKFNSIII